MNILPSRDRLIQIGSGIALSTMVYFSCKVHDILPKEKEVVAEAKNDTAKITQELRGSPRAVKLAAIQNGLDHKHQRGVFILKETPDSSEVEVFINCLPASWLIMTAAGAALPVTPVEKFAFRLDL